MAPIDPGSDHGLARLLRHLRRQPAATVPLEAVFDRWRQRRRRAWTAVGLAAAALALATILIPRATPSQPPVYLELRVVEATPDETGLPQDVLADVYDRPWEVRGP